MFDRARYEAKRVVLATLRALVQRLDPALLSVADAAEHLEFFLEVERFAAAGKTIVAARATVGERSPADALAKRAGTMPGEARAVLGTAEKLAGAPLTDAALRNGELSPKQAEAIAPAAAADPSSEQRLLDMAKCQSLSKLRDAAAEVIAATIDMEERRKQLHRDRSWRTWTNRKGARCGAYELPPEVGAEIERLAKPFIDAAFDQARREDRRESGEAYAADGLVAMARASARGGRDDAAGDAPTPRTGRRKNPAVVIVNLESLHRDRVEGDEICIIPGVGPVSVPAARKLLGDGLLRVVIRDGVDILHVTHAGRCASDVQYTAIQARQKGTCLNPCCRNRIDQIDHITGFPVTGATPVDELGGLCKRCHDLKSLYGHTYRREPDGSYTWIHPDGTEQHERPPPVTSTA